MFTAHLHLIQRLQSTIPAFAYLYNKYEKLEGEIASYELNRSNGSDLFCPETFLLLKQEKKVLHGEIYKILRKIQMDEAFAQALRN